MASSAAMALPKAMKADWSQLPQPVLVSVLQHVPVAHRLSSCALVSTSWAQAAAEATSTVTYGQGDRPQRAGDSASLQQYLNTHGRHVAFLACVLDQGGADVSAHEPCLARLPCPNLEGLLLDVAQVAAPFQQAGSMLGLLQGATGLTTLYLTVSSRWVEDVALGLSALPQLREIALAFPEDAADAAANAVFPGAVFSQLPQLNIIALGGNVGLDTLRHVSALAALQTLAVQCCDGLAGDADEGSALVAGGAVSIVDTSSSSKEEEEEQVEAASELQLLYSLHISTPGLLVGRGDSRSPCFLGLTELEKLTLDDCVLDPAVLQDMSSLHSLQLQGGVKVLGGVAGMSLLLNHISGMHGLTCLSVTRFDLREQPVAAFGAFTSSSKLKQLEVSECRLPNCSWEHMFAVGRRLSSLTELQLRGCGYLGDRLFKEKEFENLVACCSMVESLKLQNMSCRSLPFVPLLQLPHLRDLSIGGVLQADWSVGVLAQLSGLTALRLGYDCLLSPVGALQLTNLTGLQELRFVQYRDDKPLAIQSEALAGQPPDVWYHLLLYCSVDEECQALLLDQESEVLQQLQLARKDARLLQGALQAARLRKQAAAAQQCLEEGVGQALKEFDSIRDWFDEQGT